MTAFFKKHLTSVLLVLFVTLLLLSWLFPSAGFLLGLLFLLLSFLITSFTVFARHREAYRQGKISRSVFLRNGFLESTGILLAMLLAGWVGRGMAGVATQQIGSDLARVTAGILVGLLVGMGIGSLARKTWGRLAGIPPEG